MNLNGNAPTVWGTPAVHGSLLEVCYAGNSNRVLGLFTDLPKGVK